MSEPLISVIVPVFNEAETVATVLQRLLALPLRLEVIVVDDASTDGTDARLAALSDPRVRCLRHPANRGKGAAIRTGLAAASGEIILIQDADLECDPAEIPGLLAPILDGRADVVYGSRFLGAGGRVGSRLFFAGNRFLNWVTNVLTGHHFTDMETAYKVFRASVIRAIPLRCNRFDFEPEITMKIARRRCRVVELPITYRPRDHAHGKKIRWRDGVAALWCLLKYRFVD